MFINITIHIFVRRKAIKEIKKTEIKLNYQQFCTLEDIERKQ